MFVATRMMLLTVVMEMLFSFDDYDGQDDGDLGVEEGDGNDDDHHKFSSLPRCFLNYACLNHEYLTCAV